MTSSLTSAILLGSCCGPQEKKGAESNKSIWPTEQRTDQEPAALPLSIDAFAEALDLTTAKRALDPHVSGSELKDVILDFPMHFRTDLDNRIKGTELVIPWSEIERRVMSVRGEEPTREKEVLVRFYYGLHMGTFKIAMACIPIEGFILPEHRYANTPDWNERLVSPWNGESFDVDSVTSQWLTRNQAKSTKGAYFNDVLFKPQIDGKWYGMDPNNNAGYEEFPWYWELRRLRRDNDQYIVSNNELDLVINCVAGTRPKVGDRFYHTLVLHLRAGRPEVGIPFDVIADQIVPAGSFRLRGGDYGNLCPPSCPPAHPYYTVPESLRVGE